MDNNRRKRSNCIYNVSFLKNELFCDKVKHPEIQDAKIKRKLRVEVPYDLKVEWHTQKSVDAGHSPWRLDPVFVAQVYSSLLISPEGIVGDYPIPYDAISVILNDGRSAVLQINDKKSIAEKIYLQRLVRQDETGIWTVVGYDPVK